MQNSEIKTIVSEVTLLEGTFSPSNTSDLLKGFIKEKINYHKVNKLILTEGNHNDKTPYDNSRIDELKNDLAKLEEAITYARENNKDFRLNSTISIELVDKK